MHSFRWYYHRIRSMSSPEIVWRLRSLCQNILDVPRAIFALYPRRSFLNVPSSATEHNAGFSVCMIDTGSWLRGDTSSDEAAWLQKLVRKADQIKQNRLTFFDLDSQFLGDPIDWHTDHSSGKHHKLIPAALINYRDFDRVGDCKLVWEPNRHHHLVVLSRACRATGNAEYAVAVANHLESWLYQNPYGYGMNWRSPLELGIRLINWVWALDLIGDSGAIGHDLWARLYHAAYLHCFEITRKYSYGSSGNNHLIGEAAGVFVAASYFQGFPDSEQMREKSKAILEREILAQTYSDGCTREQALGYQFFVMQFFTLCALVAEWTDDPMSDEYLARLHKQYLFVAYLADGGSHLPMFGDNDDGYVLDLGDDVSDTDATLAIGGAIFDDASLLERIRHTPESIVWLFPRYMMAKIESHRKEHRRERLRSRAFTESGYYLLQGGHKDCDDAISVLFDCGDLGYGSIAAHGHADALSFTLRVGGLPIFVDPGTYDYFTYPHWRSHFRTTKAHNTLEVDDKSQSTMVGPFMWGRKPIAKCLSHDLESDLPSVAGQHDGYAALLDSVNVQRKLEFDNLANTISVVDKILTTGAHDIGVYFHLDSSVDVCNLVGGKVELVHEKCAISLILDSALDVHIIEGSERNQLGWISSSYHSKTRTKVIVGRAHISTNTELNHTIRIRL